MRLPKVFYGWWIVAAGAVLGAMNAGLYYYGFGAFFTPIIAEFGWSRAELSGAFSLGQLESGLLFPLGGLLIDRFGPRRVVAIGIALAGAGYVLLSFSQSLVMFYAIYVVVAAGATIGTTPLPSMTAISHWFVRRRGLAAGWLMAGFGVGGGLGAFLLGWLLAAYGWKVAAVALGLIFWLVGFPASRLLRHRPEEMGYRADGDERPSSGLGQSDQRSQPAPAGYVVDMRPGQALTSRAFWIITGLVSLRNLTAAAIAVHQVPLLIDRGFTLETATGILGAMVLVGVPGRLFFGWLGDRWQRRWVLAICHALMALGVTLMTAIPDANSPGMVVAFLLVFAPAYGGIWPVSIAIIADYTGRRHYGTIYGLSTGIAVSGSVLGPVLAGYTFDAFHSYTLVLLSFAAVLALSLPLFRLLGRPEPAGPAASQTPAQAIRIRPR